MVTEEYAGPWSFDRLLDLQLRLQQESFHLDPRRLEGQARAEFVRWNILALEDELHEAMQEMRWKLWDHGAPGEWVDRDAFVKELVDALHFLLNLFLTADVERDEVFTRYVAKRQVNASRQLEGYDAVASKDDAGRATDEPEPLTPAQREHLRRQSDNGYV